jgi:hypothetical protein
MMMMLKYLKYCISSLSVAVLFCSCTSDYTKMVKEELAKGVRNDSLLFGIRLGDTRNDFYGKCFDLNKQRLVAQGPGNSSVQYLFKDSLYHSDPRDMRLLFFPTFDKNETIAEMQMELSYLGWNQANRSYQSDSLLIKSLKILKDWYGGNDFVYANVDDEKIPVKVDGNRRIVLRIKDKQSVQVKVQDLLHPMFMHSITKEKSKSE